MSSKPPLPLPLPPPPPLRDVTPTKDPDDPEERLLRQFITLGTLLKVLAFVGATLAGIGGYEIVQLDKLRDQLSTLQTTVSESKVRLEKADEQIKDLHSKVDKSNDGIAELLKYTYPTKPAPPTKP